MLPKVDSDTTALKHNVRFLGEILGNVIQSQGEPGLFDAVEQIRLQSKQSRDQENPEALRRLLKDLDEGRMLDIARAFSQFLNLANIAEQHHTISGSTRAHFSADAALDKTLTQLLTTHDRPSVDSVIALLSIDLVLTAHPTEITRRTLIHKHSEINECLDRIELAAQTGSSPEAARDRLAELITQIWHTEEFRTDRPTPIDEARWGFAVIENSLWNAVPAFLRIFDDTCTRLKLERPKDTWRPVQISSWIGGDRDGNPNVTAEVTREVLLLAQWQACSLFEADIEALYEDLSINTSSAAFRLKTGNAHEPYRYVLKPLREALRTQQAAIESALQGRRAAPEPLSREALLEPLEACKASLEDIGLQSLANSRLRDTIRRVHCFGPHLLRLDIRQESARHTLALSELTRALSLGDYGDWSEAQRLSWLREELNNPRPLLPGSWAPSEETAEVFNTFRVIAETPREALGCYVISMAGAASDVLAVQLLLKATQGPLDIPVAPLFETLDDLARAPAVINEILADADFRHRGDHQMTVMIGYSDSAKDAGMLAAGWAQYRAQEQLLDVCKQHGVALHLFHGRGGSIGRGGAPAHDALLSQPPGSLINGLRVTEQGEMIRTKLGLTPLAVNTLGRYASAILEANLAQPPSPQGDWRRLMEELAADSCDDYRKWVRGDDKFVPYFRSATPEQELASLPLGSRPTRRRSDGGIASLRAIPWIFAWSQNRLMLPAWLGAGSALGKALQDGHAATLRDMARRWPFFAARLSMLEMVFAKADRGIAALYDQLLVSDELAPIGDALRQQLLSDQATLLEILEADAVLEDNPWGRDAIALRDIYTAPLNLLQAELLRRQRQAPDIVTERALMVTIAGVAAGLRNTG